MTSRPPATTIGVHVHAKPAWLHATLGSLLAHAPGARVVLLPDGPDELMQVALSAIELPQLWTPEPQGVPACWNRLIAATDAEVVVLLESGSVLSPGALEILLGALREPMHGLAGPSTNLAWNEQAAFRGACDGEAAIAATARLARARFGDAVRPLTPLHSLADFCFAVRRDVIEAVGPADEGYGLGPCWEMDYSIRAARAGFLGVWACAAYVHRAPFTARRRTEEARRFEASKQRYQDKFCGRRLRGVRGAYEPHCKGEECAEFAPPALIRIREVPAAAATAPSDAATPLASTTAVTAPASPPRAQIAAAASPLRVVCIMPTRDRRAFVPGAIRCFLRQDYAARELLIVDDGADAVRDLVPDDPRIRYVRLDGPPRTVGAKRNLACAQAQAADVIAHWDDDDWYPPWRLRAQVDAIASGADVCGTSQVYYLAHDRTCAWRYSYGGGEGFVGGNTLAYRRRVWEVNRFPEVQIGEDVRFLRTRGRAQLRDLADPSLCIATLHGGNTSPKRAHDPWWATVPVASVLALIADDDPAPLVSCIMPTADRRPFVAMALASWAAQSYPNREIIAVDDGQEPVGDLVEQVPGARYIRLAARTSIGEKRNAACRAARGAIVVQWDDDDFYAPDRLSYQCEPIVAGRADITGLENRYVLQLPEGRFWTTTEQLHRRMFVGDIHGGTLAYRRALVERGAAYPHTSLAEDAAFLRAALARGARLARLPNTGVFVYVRHGRNAWQFEPGRFVDARGWSHVEPPAQFTDERLQAYRAALASLQAVRSAS